MSQLIAGTEGGVTITQYSRGRGKFPGFQVTWSTDRGISHLSFDDEQKARAFFHLVYCSLDVA